MSIPPNITKHHIELAMQEIDKNGIPENRNGRKYFLLYNGKKYPLKLIISIANRFANGKELDPNPSNFQSIMSKKLLKQLGFKIIKIEK